MKSIEKLDIHLRDRPDDWWPRLVKAIPELEPLEETPQPPEYHAEGDVATHTRLAIEACPPNCDPDLPWVALLHDIGKPETTQIKVDGRITAYGHDKLGARKAEKILKRLGMEPQRRERVIWTIRHHMFHHAWQLKSESEITKRQRAYLEHPDFPLLLEFLRIDATASHGKTDKMSSYHFYKDVFDTVMNQMQDKP